MSKSKLYTILACIYCGCLIVANTITGKTFDVISWTWTSAFIVFPVTYIINDVITEVYGFAKAKSVIITAFAVNLLAVVFYQAALAMPGSPTFDAQAAFETVFTTTPRALVSSFAGYLCGGLINASIMQRLHDRDGEKHLMARCVISTLFGEMADAAVFNILMWSFVLPWQTIIITIITYGLGKVLYEIIVYPVTQLVIRHVKALED